MGFKESFMRNTPIFTATNAIVIACIIIYFALEQIFGQNHSGFELFFFENPDFKPFQLVSHMFLHGDPTHLFFNMFGLWMFGNTLERTWGSTKFVTFYFICGLGAAAIYLGVNYFQFQSTIAPLIEAGFSIDEMKTVFANSQYYSQFPDSQEATLIFKSPVVGASGALYGVLVAFAFLFPNHKIMLIFLPVPIAAKFFVPALLCLDIFSGFTGISIFGKNIAHAAHVGGAVTAIILLLTVMKNKRNTVNDSYGVWRK